MKRGGVYIVAPLTFTKQWNNVRKKQSKENIKKKRVLHSYLNYWFKRQMPNCQRQFKCQVAHLPFTNSKFNFEALSILLQQSTEDTLDSIRFQISEIKNSNRQIKEQFKTKNFKSNIQKGKWEMGISDSIRFKIEW